MGKPKTINSGNQERALQIATAQDTYRARMRDKGFHRLQEWLPDDVYAHLQLLCEKHGLTQREVLVRSLTMSKTNHDMPGEKDDHGK